MVHSEWPPHTTMFVSHISACQKETTAEKSFKSLVDKMSCLVHITQPFSPTTFVVTVAEMNVLHRLSEQRDLLFTNPGVATITAEWSKFH